MAPRRRPTTPHGFYEAALSRAERVRLPGARRLEDLEEEIALLRVRLLRALEEHPENFPLLLKGMSLLVRLVATQHRISPKGQQRLGEQLAQVINSLGEQLFPEGYRDGQ